VRRSISPWLLLALVTAVCAAALVGVASIRARGQTEASLIERLPVDSTAIVYMDFAALRRAGITAALAAPEGEREEEYRAFVDGTGFEYTRDLDSVIFASSPRGRFFLARGRFDWGRLSDYVRSRGGVCHNTFCRTEGSRPDRQVSYFPLERDLMALAVSPDEWAASELQVRKPQEIDAPKKPVWAIFTAAALAGGDDLPKGARLLAAAVEGADRVLLTAGPAPGGVEIGLDAACRSDSSAADLKDRLSKLTALVNELLRSEGHQPDPSDLSGILAGGAFEQKGTHVVGSWPVSKHFLESIAGVGL